MLYSLSHYHETLQITMFRDWGFLPSHYYFTWSVNKQMVGLIALKLNQQHTLPTLLMNALNTGISAPASPPPLERNLK